MADLEVSKGKDYLRLTHQMDEMKASHGRVIRELKD